MQPHLANSGNGGATLRFGRVWTAAMITQVALTAIAMPVAIEGASQAIRNVRIRAEFPTGEYLAARLDLDRSAGEATTSAFEERRARTYAALERRIAQEPGVVAVTFADRAPGTSPPRSRSADIDIASGAGPAFDYSVCDIGGGPRVLYGFRPPNRCRACLPRRRLQSHRER